MTSPRRRRRPARRLAALPAALMLALLPAAPGRAAPGGGWRFTGPPGGGVHALAIGTQAPERVWAGTVYGHYVEPKPGQAMVSDDGARTWTVIRGLALQPIDVFAVDRTTPTWCTPGRTATRATACSRPRTGARAGS